MGATPTHTPADASALTTAEMLAALPEGLMLPAGALATERKVADVLALYRAVFLNSSDPIAIVDTMGRYLEQNPAHERLLGYSADELRGATPAIHLGDDMFAAIAADLQRSGVSRREVRSRTRDGRERIIDLSSFAVRDRTGHAVCYVGITRDITDQRESAQALTRRVEELQSLYRMSEALGHAAGLDDIYDEAIDALLQAIRADRASVLVFDSDGVMRFKAWRSLSDAYRGAVEGHSPWARDTRNARPITVADVEQSPDLAALLPVIRGEGIRALAFIPLLDETGVLGKFMLYFDSTHHWTDSEVQLARSIARHVAFALVRHAREAELREANRAKSVFLATMSHELRTPLNAIAGYTDLLDAGIHGELEASQREAVVRIQANQRHLLRLIDDVLDFAKLEAGYLQLEITNIPVQETLDGTRALIEPQLRAKTIRFDFAPGDTRITCRGDRAKVQQILANLLSNAWKFTPPGGTIAMDWEYSDETVRITVRDTGAGIPESNFEDIFAPFVQLQTGFRRKVEGTGLGLAISRELARGMGGDVTIASVVGKGSTFTLTLPRA
jgi:PAS domain S-box-containing protein